MYSVDINIWFLFTSMFYSKLHNTWKLESSNIKQVLIFPYIYTVITDANSINYSWDNSNKTFKSLNRFPIISIQVNTVI